LHVDEKQCTSCAYLFSTNMQQVVSAAVEGTKNAINAAADVGVKRVVFTSSYGAVHMDPNRSPDQTLDESCWSDLEFCKQTKVHCSSLNTFAWISNPTTRDKKHYLYIAVLYRHLRSKLLLNHQCMHYRKNSDYYLIIMHYRKNSDY
jgi:hypothetical protein